MSDATYIGGRASRLESTPPFQTYSRVVIHVSDDADDDIVVGNSTGRTLEVDNPWGTVAMAQNMLSALNGYQYQPYTAYGAALNPAAEIGDAVTVGDVYGGIYTRQTAFGRLMKADISAPQDEEIDHEYKFESPERREFARSIDEVKASLILTNDQIRADVVKKTDGSTESFGWSLLSSGWSVNSGGQTVLKVDRNGLEVAGTIKAGTRIGADGGFVISASAIYNGISEFGGTQSRGVYLGTNGIQLGQRFKVDSSGNVSASNMTLSGTLKIGSTTITADNLRLGAERANSGYSSWNGTTSTVNISGSYWSGGASYGYDYSNATSSTSGRYPSYFRAESVYTSNMLYANGGFSLGGEPVSKTTISIRDYSGITRTFKVLTYGY